ncbi:hypothetical protein [Streptococcus parauberis]|uniref:hypothetical protein n=1 Tax=Streptococcus parauberis TaxID=1348 RepID=UPI0003161B05|nr:hypothetical protein [Streptococcus parauberis]QBX27358.1 hypothetical protein Javan384_0023 [Streptococcus phage Javan384]UWM90519.1 hypothetical protein N2A94_08435 [Streptococcus parauberis]UWM91278.1 hypothetical protein N2A94_01240 [Streptococcus parauberis]
MKNVKIGGLTYEIVKVNDLAIKEDVIGRIKYYEAKIELEKWLSKQVEEQTLVHEILHGCFKEAGYDDQEEVIDRVGKVLYQVLKDNDFSFVRGGQ